MDPYRKVQPGERLKVPARAWNALVGGLNSQPEFTVSPSNSSGNSIVVRISQYWPTLDHTPLKVGHGISIPLNRGTQTLLLPTSKNTTGSATSKVVSSEDDLVQFSTADTPCFTIESGTTDTSLGSRCGIIESVSALVDGYYTCTVRVRGLVRCRVLLLQAGASVSPPPPYPTNATLRTFWRRYLMASTYGYGAILGIGARYRLNGTNTYPAVAEAVVNLG
jgi:hypothetical protein